MARKGSLIIHLVADRSFLHRIYSPVGQEELAEGSLILRCQGPYGPCDQSAALNKSSFALLCSPFFVRPSLMKE
ncbi:hypothetical protein GCM10017771_41760 [Streptomyces capitiformicae]|uniref:Uncharacterized protein n=1 Tax=Streptomyces capitiformicae TaxID=2014920 RepID=A0A919GWU0_9ACTN|nr:hypothetical protein GCM10017771_41760 [Streptomyces capitiformicae]